MGNYSEAVEAQMMDFFCSLNERDRRRYAAIEAVKLGYGGIQYISQLLGCHRETNVLCILHDHTAGDPMRQEVRWSNLSRRNISRELEKTDTPASKNVVFKVLYEQGFRRRQLQKKEDDGP